MRRRRWPRNVVQLQRRYQAHKGAAFLGLVNVCMVGSWNCIIMGGLSGCYIVCACTMSRSDLGVALKSFL